MGAIERGVHADLKTMPTALRLGTLGRLALALAHDLDGDLTPRDMVVYAAQLRQCMIQLHDWAPGEVHGDSTDAAEKKRSDRLEKSGLRLAVSNED